ncbi:MAG: NADH-quinone oxidoreductase subunit NuoE [Treponema sp.]|nr:NADH-quinone oxidoreductase subunit NuoE [Treponema sp.]MCL2237722.1 NADH-quinone oxidoreductase subunit NuoE [Treponema sp.]
MCNCAEKNQANRNWYLFDNVMKNYAGGEPAKFEESMLIPVLQKLQEAYGYLPQDVIQRLSEKTGIFVSQIMGVVTFYSQFRLKPVGKNIVRVCFGTACHVNGAENIADAICRELNIELGGTTEDKMFTVESVACLGCCSLAPVIMINDETHGRLSPDSARNVIRQAKEKNPS